MGTSNHFLMAPVLPRHIASSPPHRLWNSFYIFKISLVTKSWRLGVEHVLTISSSYCLRLGFSRFPSLGSAVLTWTGASLQPHHQLPPRLPLRPDEDGSYPALLPTLMSAPTGVCLLSGLIILWFPACTIHFWETVPQSIFQMFLVLHLHAHGLWAREAFVCLSKFYLSVTWENVTTSMKLVPDPGSGHQKWI